MKRYPVLNLWIDNCNMSQALNQVRRFIDTGKKVHTIFASNPEKNYTVPANRLLHRMFREADLLIPDGIGMVLAARWLYKTPVQRVPGCELMQNICALAEKRGYGIFIYGAKEPVSRAAAKELMKRHPLLNIAGRQHGYISENDTKDLLNRINTSKARILFLALGSPKQERWIFENRHRLKHIRVCQGIGGTLDVLAGTVKRAPDIYCRYGLEWLYRLLSEPSRIKRQIKLPLFAAQVAFQKLRR